MHRDADGLGIVIAQSIKFEHCVVLSKHTLFKVLYFILANFKNHTLFILFFNQILFIGLNCLKGSKCSIFILFSLYF